MNLEEFRAYGHQMVDWMADYLRDIETYPVKSQVAPGDIIGQLPVQMPKQGEGMEKILSDFQQIIMPGITHWQHPGFYAYFPANSSFPSVLAEMLTATLGAQCMIWDTSPAAAELEERMMEWLQELLDLPGNWVGALQATASEATLVALLSAREQASNWRINQEGFSGQEKYRIYASSETHSSIEKAVKIAGFGRENLVYVRAKEDLSLDPKALRQAIESDIRAGLKPLCAIATLGTTSTTAIDPVGDMGAICKEFGLWLHVDAAYGGSALALPALRPLAKGLELADSFVFNPHKWLLTNFDCSAYYVQDKAALLRTFEILPEYLKTTHDKQVNNYRDWGIPLGRRFRALKLWFVLRHYGAEGIRAVLQQHMDWATELEGWVNEHPDFKQMAPRSLNLVCFRYAPAGQSNTAELDRLNQVLLQQLNASGKIYLTHTKVKGAYTLRLVIGQSRMDRQHVVQAWEQIVETASQLQ
ncbi:MAG: pyridoxal-dependent decarboxylase [Bacteroidota bacterium]